MIFQLLKSRTVLFALLLAVLSVLQGYVGLLPLPPVQQMYVGDQRDRHGAAPGDHSAHIREMIVACICIGFFVGSIFGAAMLFVWMLDRWHND